MLINSNFNKLFWGRSVSNIGDSLYSIALSWYIFQLTNSSLWVGYLNFALFLPDLFSFLLGDFIERSNKRKLLILIEIAQGLLLLPIVFIIPLSMDITTKAFFICVFAFFVAFFGNNAYVVQDVLVPEIVPEKKLSKSSMLLSFSYSTMDYIGNAIGGLLLKVFSIFSLLITDIITFFISAFLFFRMDTSTLSEVHESKEKNSVFSGMNFIWNRKDLLVITLFNALGNFFFGGLAVFAVLIGNNLGGSAYYGILLALESVGVTIGSTIFATLLLKFIKLGKMFSVSTLGMGIFLIASCYFNNNYIFLSLWTIAFIFQGLNRVVTTPYLQASTEKGQRAKFFSSFNTLTIIPLPIGSLFFGKLSTIIDWKIFVIIFAIYMIIFTILFALNKKISTYEE